MKKILLILAVAGMATSGNATILRVSNVSGSTAPYETLEAAHEAANTGDTIMVDGSSTSYGEFKITKTITLIGPGYMFLTNNIAEEALQPARFDNIWIDKEAPGTVIEGVYVTDRLYTEAEKTIVKRCWVIDQHYTGGGLFFHARNCVAHQNIVSKIDSGAFYVDDYNDQITNNIILGSIQAIGGSYIAYNTFLVDYSSIEPETLNLCFGDIINSTIENNIIPSMGIGTNGWNDIESNKFVNNHVYGPQTTGQLIPYSLYITDRQAMEVTQALTEAGYGAFAGDSPYVLSGIPSGPVIQDLIIPTTVEMGSKMNVTIKIGMVK